MSSQEEKKIVNSQEERQTDQSNKKKEEKKNDKKNAQDWHKQANTVARSQVECVTHQMSSIFNVNNQKNEFSVDMLKLVPDSIPTIELVTTGSSDILETFEALQTFFASRPHVQNHTSFFGVYLDEQCGSSCEFAVSSYKTAINEIVFTVDRTQGCGIAFSRLFSQFNQEISNNKNKEIWTFEAPALAPLSPQPLQQHSSMADSCPFDHAVYPGAQPLQWATTAILDLCASSLSPLNNENLDLQPVPLSASAQAQMFTQCFDSLITTLQTTPVLNELPAAEFDALTSFLSDLFTNHTGSNDFNVAYPKLNFLLSHPILSTRISTLALVDLVSSAYPQYVFQVVDHNMLEYLSAANNQQCSAEDCSPFDFLHHQTIEQYIQALSAQYQHYAASQ